MGLHLFDLDTTTRQYMHREFVSEQASADPYLPLRLTARGADLWPTLMLDVIQAGNDENLVASLYNVPGALMTTESYNRGGVLRSRTVNTRQASQMLGTSEFNTWYVRGLSARLLEEGVETVEVYRAAAPKWEPSSCSSHEGLLVSTRDVYDGHRATYWPVENPAAFSVPFQPGCHHSIRRPSTLTD